MSPDPSMILEAIRARIADRELLVAMDRVEDALVRGREPAQLAADMGLSCGVSGYIHHTVPICLHAWLRSAPSWLLPGRAFEA